VRRARAQWYSVKSELENELADEELRRSLRQARSDLEEARDSLAQGGAALQRDLEQARDEVESSVRVPAPAAHADDAAAGDATAESLSPPQRPSTERTPDA
jgi:sec-independent protein translocase protein TatB